MTWTKFENNWLTKTLESLEKDYLGEIKDNSHLVVANHILRKKQLKDFDIEDLRIMISQNTGLKYLIPLALNTLEKNILAEGDFYEGDLLAAVLKSDKKYWIVEKRNWERMCRIFKQNAGLLISHYTSNTIKKDLLELFAEFERIN